MARTWIAISINKHKNSILIVLPENFVLRFIRAQARLNFGQENEIHNVINHLKPNFARILVIYIISIIKLLYGKILNFKLT